MKANGEDSNFQVKDLKLYIMNKLRLKRVQNAFENKTSLNPTRNGVKVNTNRVKSINIV